MPKNPVVLKQRRTNALKISYCSRCFDEPIVPQRSMCRRCLRHHAYLVRLRRSFNKALGLCANCGHVPPILLRTLCLPCARSQKQRNQRAYHKTSSTYQCTP